MVNRCRGARAVSGQRESRARAMDCGARAIRGSQSDSWFTAGVDVRRARNIRILARRLEQRSNLEAAKFIFRDGLAGTRDRSGQRGGIASGSRGVVWDQRQLGDQMAARMA